MNSGMDTAERKAALRREGRAARNALSEEERKERSRILCERIAELPDFRAAKTVLLYRAVRGEADLSLLAEEAERLGKTVAYPFCRPDRTFAALVPEEGAWIRGSFGIPEPDPARSRELAPEEIDLAVCPCSRFDGRGYRVGMGGGFYDRFLSGFGGTAVLAAFAVQEAPEVPVDSWDLRIPVIVTEEGVKDMRTEKDPAVHAGDGNTSAADAAAGKGLGESLSSADFARALASKTSVPGGGGAAALTGALAAGLGSMVGEFTVGKKRYADVEEDIRGLMAEAARLREELLACIDADAEAFEPLSRAYGIPKDDPQREATLEACLRDASDVPLRVMALGVETARVLEGFGAKGSRLMISDAAAGAALCLAAMRAAAINVRVNTRLMKDRREAEERDARAASLLAEGEAMAERTFAAVWEALS